MKPDQKRTDAELLAWVASIVQNEQQARTFGKVIVHMDRGRIMRVVIEKTEIPPE